MVHRWVHASALGVTLLIVLACGGTASGTPAVLGPWEAAPFDPPDPSLTRAAEASCREKTPQSAGIAVVLHDQRGNGIDTVLFVGPNGLVSCQVSGAVDGSVTWLTSGAGAGPPSEMPPPLSLQVSSMGSTSGSDVQTVSDIIGRTGAGVVKVRLLLTDGSEVIATSSNGWFYAWWPGDATAATLFGDDVTGRMVVSATP